MERREILGQPKRILVKVGSNVLTGPQGPKEDVIERLCEDIAEVRSMGVEVIMVSSGAISSGLRKMGLRVRPKELSQLQALASIGQGALMGMYEKGFERWGIRVAQILITKEDLGSRKRYLNIINTLFTLLHWGVIPIINENDTVTVEEIKFGDNDTLAALISIFTECHLFVNLTSTEGLYDRDPKEFPHARLVSLVERVDKAVLSYASKDKSLFGTGGMESKLLAAKKVAMAGIPTVIANGNKERVVSRLLKGEDIGTLILPFGQQIPKKKHWLAFGS
ncbi:MAG: glutamate 5-kinase, partial [Desulfatiglandales bacterium]